MILIIQHVNYEPPGFLSVLLEKYQLAFQTIHIAESQQFPDLSSLDGLIIMGGPMSVLDESEYPWLIPEKDFIRKCILSSIPILGICLGAQLIAEQLGGQVVRSPQMEIGWFPVNGTNHFSGFEIAEFPRNVKVFHWHGEMFVLPSNVHPFYASEACPNQAFFCKPNIWGFQFHLEMTPEIIKDLYQINQGALDLSLPFVMSEVEVEGSGNFAENHKILEGLFIQWLKLKEFSQS